MLVVPPLPALERLNLAVGVSHHGNMYTSIDRIITRLSGQFQLIPTLSTIQCLAPGDFTFQGRYDIIPNLSNPPSWRDSGFSGIIFYSWARPRPRPLHTCPRHERNPDNPDELAHFRTRLQSNEAETETETESHSPSPVMGVGRSSTSLPTWRDTAWYRGKKLPVRVLAAAYAAAGVVLGKTEPGRGLELPIEGWRVLDHWTCWSDAL
jgi:hypothetical protein